MNDNIDRSLEGFKKLIPHLRGALWWANNALLKERLEKFNKDDDHVGHPVLSLRKEAIESRIDAIPMLIGTSGGRMNLHRKNCCIDVIGMTRQDPERHTYFGSIIEPMLVTVGEMLKDVGPKKDDYLFCEKDRHAVGPSDEKAFLRIGHRLQARALMPNWHKPMVDADEMEMVDCYCAIHKL